MEIRFCFFFFLLAILCSCSQRDADFADQSSVQGEFYSIILEQGKDVNQVCLGRSVLSFGPSGSGELSKDSAKLELYTEETNDLLLQVFFREPKTLALKVPYSRDYHCILEVNQIAAVNNFSLPDSFKLEIVSLDSSANGFLGDTNYRYHLKVKFPGSKVLGDAVGYRISLFRNQRELNTLIQREFKLELAGQEVGSRNGHFFFNSSNSSEDLLLDFYLAQNDSIQFSRLSQQYYNMQQYQSNISRGIFYEAPPSFQSNFSPHLALLGWSQVVGIQPFQ